LGYGRLNVSKLETFEGVYYAATVIKAKPCRDEAVVVVGDSNSAGQAAVFLSEYAREVHIMIRGSDVVKSMSH
jgi:thioredoxin reductase (NADPH)